MIIIRMPIVIFNYLHNQAWTFFANPFSHYPIDIKSNPPTTDRPVNHSSLAISNLEESPRNFSFITNHLWRKLDAHIWKLWRTATSPHEDAFMKTTFSSYAKIMKGLTQSLQAVLMRSIVFSQLFGGPKCFG